MVELSQDDINALNNGVEIMIEVQVYDDEGCRSHVKNIPLVKEANTGSQ